MTTARYSLALASTPPRNLQEAKQRLAEITAYSNEVIKILTAEQAIKAAKVVREAGEAKARRRK